jgi:predicted ATPase
MALFTGLGLENFRVFKDETFFEFAPITVLTGANNSGKSSVLKSLLLLHDNASKNALMNLNFIGKHHNLGEFSQVLSNEGNSLLKFSLFYKLEEYEYNLFTHNTVLERFYGLLGIETFRIDLVYEKSLHITEDGVLKKTSLWGIDEQNISFKILELIFEQETEFYTECFLNLDLFFNLKPKFEIEESEDSDLSITNKNLEIQAFNELLKSFNLSSKITNESYFQEKYNLKGVDNEEFTGFIGLINEKLIAFFSYAKFPINKLFFENSADYIDEFFRLGRQNISTNTDYITFNKTEIEKFANIINKIAEQERIYLELKEYSFKINDIITKDFSIFFYNFLGQNQYIHKLNRPNSLLGYIFEELTIKSRRVIDIPLSVHLHYVPSQRLPINRVLLLQQDIFFNNLLLEFRNSSPFEKERIIKLINQWLQELNLADEVKIEPKQGIVEILLKKQETWLNIFDLGVGTIQMLSIFLHTALFYNKIQSEDYINRSADSFPKQKNALMLIEEPENNLHPKLQSVFADWLKNINKVIKNKIIIETHSEYLIRKLQYWIAKKEIHPKDVVLYYLHDPNNIPKDEKQVKKMDILLDGSLSDDFGEGFFDEATKWRFELLKLKNQN